MTQSTRLPSSHPYISQGNVFPLFPSSLLSLIFHPLSSPSSSSLYQIFDAILVLSHGRTLYTGPGSFAPVEHFERIAPGAVSPYIQGYNVADYLLDVASDPPVVLFQTQKNKLSTGQREGGGETQASAAVDTEKQGDVQSETSAPAVATAVEGSSEKDLEKQGDTVPLKNKSAFALGFGGSRYAATFLTQFQVLSGREWKILWR